jgi:hypothetical protein
MTLRKLGGYKITFCNVPASKTAVSAFSPFPKWLFSTVAQNCYKAEKKRSEKQLKKIPYVK